MDKEGEYPSPPKVKIERKERPEVNYIDDSYDLEKDELDCEGIKVYKGSEFDDNMDMKPKRPTGKKMVEMKEEGKSKVKKIKKK